MRGSPAVFRLGLAPVLLLGWNMATGDPLPFLAPSLLVTILAGSPNRPKLGRLAGALALVVGLTWVITEMYAALADTPASVWIVLVALATAAFGRLARRPGDMLAILTLMVASIAVVIREWAGDLGLVVPWLLGFAMVQAIVAALIAHALLPSIDAPVPAPVTPPGGTAEVIEAVGKSLGLVGLLGAALHLEDNSAILVALTAVNVLAASSAETRGRMLLIANAAAAAMALPLLAVASARTAPVVLLLMALAGGLWMARGIGQQGTRRVIAQAGLPVFVVLLGGLLPKAGDAAVSLLADRLLTLGVVMACALGLLAVLGTVGRREIRAT